MVAGRLLEEGSIGIADCGRPLPSDPPSWNRPNRPPPANALCRAPASGAVSVWRTVMRARSVRMLSARPWNSSFPVLMNPTSESSAPLKAFAKTCSVAAAASLLSAT
jgi:hypothetical protein